VLGLLLLAQAAAMIGLSTTYLSPTAAPVGWSRIFIGGLTVLVALLALSAAVGFFRLRPGAWPGAMLVQALTLFMAQVVYFRERPHTKLHYIYLLMLYAVFMVVYLHQADVLAALRPRTEHRERRV
jgi:hypothetical protein